MESSPPSLDHQTWDVIVVGGGLLGSSIAYHLACAGVRTLLLEQADLASGASGANFGNVQVQDAEFGLSLEWTLQGRDRCAQLEDELETDLDYRRAGSVLLVENEHQHALMVDRAARLVAAGLRAEWLDQAALLELEPYLSPETVLGGLYHPDEGQLNPFKLVHAYAHRGAQHGLVVRTHTPVAGITVQKGRVTGVEVAGDHLLAGNVVLATGAWTRALGQTAGVALPARWIHGEALITEAVPPVVRNALSSASFFEDSAGGMETVVALAMKQRGEGRLMLGEAITATDRLDRGISGTSVGAIAKEGRRRLPRLGQVAILRSWGIPVAYTADNCPLLGRVAEVEHLYAATALKSTIVLTPVVGEWLARMVTGGAVDPRLEAFAPSRRMSPSNNPN